MPLLYPLKQYFLILAISSCIFFPVLTQASSQSNGTLLRCPLTFLQYNSGDYDQDLTGCSDVWDNSLNGSLGLYCSLNSPDVLPTGGIARDLPGAWQLLPSFVDRGVSTEMPYYNVHPDETRGNLFSADGLGSFWAPWGKAPICWGSGITTIQKSGWTYYGASKARFLEVAEDQTVTSGAVANVWDGSRYVPQTIKVTNTFISRKKASDDPIDTIYGQTSKSKSNSNLEVKNVFNQCGPNLLFKNNRCVECVTDTDCESSLPDVIPGPSITTKCLPDGTPLNLSHTSCSVCENIGDAGDTGAKEIIFVTNQAISAEEAKKYVASIKSIQPYKYLGSLGKFSFKLVSGDLRQVGKIKYVNTVLDPAGWSKKISNKSTKKITNFAIETCNLSSQSDHLVVILDFDAPSGVGGYAASRLKYVYLKADVVDLLPAINHELGHAVCGLDDEYPYKYFRSSLRHPFPVGNLLDISKSPDCAVFTDAGIPKQNCFLVKDKDYASTPGSLMKNHYEQPMMNRASCMACLSSFRVGDNTKVRDICNGVGGVIKNEELVPQPPEKRK